MVPAFLRGKGSGGNEEMAVIKLLITHCVPSYHCYYRHVFMSYNLNDDDLFWVIVVRSIFNWHGQADMHAGVHATQFQDMLRLRLQVIEDHDRSSRRR